MTVTRTRALRAARRRGEPRFADDRLRRWLLVRGRGDRPLDARVDAATIRAHSSSKRPSVQRGDRAILYGAVWQCVFGVVQVTGDPENDPTRTRWSWRFPLAPVTLVPDLHAAPAAEEVGIFPQSLSRHSHIRLTEEQFERARAAIEVVGFAL